MMTNREAQIQAQVERTVRRAAFYMRSVARNSMKRGRSYAENMPVRFFDLASGKYETGYKRFKKRSRSTPPNSPHYHMKGGAGLKLIWAEKFMGRRDAYVVGPLVFKTKGSNKVSFKIHSKLSKGGGGKMYCPVNNNNAMSRAQMFQRGFKKASWDWVPVKYRPRPYMRNAIAPTRAKFPSLWYSSRNKG